MNYLIERILSLRVFNYILAPTMLITCQFGGILWTVGFFLALERAFSIIELFLKSVECYFEDNPRKTTYFHTVALITIVFMVPFYHIIIGIKDAFYFDEYWNSL